MASYTTTANLLKRINSARLSELSDDRDLPQDSLDYTATAAAAVITQAISDASNTIDWHLAGHVDLTSGTVQGQLEQWAAALALDALYRRRVENEHNPWYERAQKIEAYMGKVQRGELHSAASPTTPSQAFVSTTTTQTRVFGDVGTTSGDDKDQLADF